MKASVQVVPSFQRVELISKMKDMNSFVADCAYLLDEKDSLADFIEKIGKEHEKKSTPINLYNLHIAYNLKFPTTPSTVSLINEVRIIAMGIEDLFELLDKLPLKNQGEDQFAVFLSVEGRSPDEMLKIKREIFQQFIYLRMYIPIIIAENYQEAKSIFDKLQNPGEMEKTAVTFVGTKKAGKSSLINAILGAQYSPSSSELPTPNKMTYAWSGENDNSLRVKYKGKTKHFQHADELCDYLVREFRKANREQSAALKAMEVFIPTFPENLRNFTVVDTPGPNLAASKDKAHEQIALAAIKEMQHGVFVMNYSSHLTDDEMKLFDVTYRIFNNKRRHQTVIVAVNRIDEMYAADVIKSYERFADYVRVRLNRLGYENIVVVGISALIAVYAEKLREILPTSAEDIGRQLEDLEFDNDDYNTVVEFMQDTLKRMRRFHKVKIKTLDELKSISRIDYLSSIIQVAYNPAEHFEWIDETFEDIFEEDFVDDDEFVEKVRYFAENGNPDAMNMLGIMYSQGDIIEKDDRKAFKWCYRAAEAGNPFGMSNVAYSYRYGVGVKKNISQAVEWYNKAIDADNTHAMCELAAMYRDGDNLKKDEEKALGLFQRAAEADDVDAMTALGSMYYRGEGTKKNLKLAYKWTLKAAEAGNISAMNRLGVMYDQGDGTAIDHRAAIAWYQKAAEEGHSIAMSNLAYSYRQGEGVDKSFSNAVYWYEQSIENGNEDALYDLGDLYYDNNYPVKAFKYLKQAAEKGNVNAMNWIGTMYYTGNGTEKNRDIAAHWYQKAAENGHSWGMWNWAECLYHGHGVKKDYNAAFNWYTRAAKAGIAEAMNDLGDMYYNGLGIRQNYQEAVKWYRKAAAEDHGWAMWNLGHCYQNGYGVSASFSDAIFWFKRAADTGNDDALKQLGNMYRNKEQYTEALKWYHKAADKGDADCMNYIGVMYHNGEGVTSSYSTALNWYKRAADAGSMWAVNNLGNSYYNGYGVAKDYKKAIKYFRRAANEGNITASMISLGNMCRYGNGVAQDYNKAMFWYEKAREHGDEDAQEYIDSLRQERTRSSGSSSSGSSSGGCYITTAVCDSLGKTDDCYELVTFRHFRDNWLIKQSDGEMLIREYYNVAPYIVEQINKRADAAKIYRSIWYKFLVLCLEHIERGELQQCKNTYLQMVRYLANKFLKF